MVGSTTGSIHTNVDIADEAKVGNYPESKLLEEAKRIVEERIRDWQNIDPHDEERIPKFHRDEIVLGNILGKGGFFVVREVANITLLHNSEDEGLDNSDAGSLRDSEFVEDEEEDRINAVVQSRKFMAKQCLRHGKNPRYAFKTMQGVNRTDPDTFLNSVVDMAIEVKFLASVRHPNILKMTAVSAGSLYQPDAFMILDKIYDTLEVRIDKWKQKDQSPFGKFFGFQKRKEKSLAKRLLVAFDVASALAYLHDINIMYRDLKPTNIGFDVRDDAKLFDFGLATEFRPEELENGSFKLTGDTGTMRYMAPEVALSRPYTEKADVYSFGIMLWQMIELETPYEKLHDDAIHRKVVDLGIRPKIDPEWPASIQRLLEDCFASSPYRPSMDVICTVLRHEIKLLSEHELLDDEDLLDSARSALSARYIGTY